MASAIHRGALGFALGAWNHAPHCSPPRLRPSPVVDQEAQGAAVRFQAAKHNVICHLEIEAQDESWLSMPSMSTEEEPATLLPGAWPFEAIKVTRAAKYRPHRLAVDQLDHLKISRK